MHTSVLKLLPENVVELAKDVIRPTGWYCEWNTSNLQKPVQCRTFLNSWNAYRMHLQNHCKQPKAAGLVCRLPRCNIPAGFPSMPYAELLKHIEQSHLNRSQLVCPIRDCPSVGFSRHQMLQTHFSEAHADLIGKDVAVSSPLLLPFRTPYHPDCSSLPPPIPAAMPPGTALLPPVRGTPLDRSMEMSNSFTLPSSQQSQLSQGSPKKRPQLKRTASEETVVPAAPEIVFADLPRGGAVDNIWSSCVIRKVNPDTPDVSRPQDILDPERYGHKTPPGSILYENFVRIHADALKGVVDSEASEKAHVQQTAAEGSGVLSS